MARTAPDIYFFFLRWLHDNLDRLPRQDTRKRILGVLTAIAFFAPNPSAFIARLWKRKSGAWWQGTFLEKNMRMKDDKLVMLPLPSPEELQKSLSEVLPENEWKNWNWYDNLTRQYPKKANSIYAQRCKNLLGSENNDVESRPVDMAWSAFWGKLWDERRLVLYTQRHWIDTFFPGYNPAAPDQIEDSDRPFDWDHIFPQSYIYNMKRPILNLWRDRWPRTIGNLRAWPMELNRSDGKMTPTEKLSNGIAESFGKQWNKILPDSATVREASFIDEDGWKDWQKCDGDEWDIKQALTHDSELGKTLLKAITERLCAIYTNWYESLDVGNTLS